MEELGIVSLWLGEVDASESLEQFVNTNYSEDGDFENSDFGRAFRISFYDEDFLEAEFFERSYTSISELLQDSSYEEILIPKFSAINEPLVQAFNSIILVYNFRYSGTVEEWRQASIYFRFFGSVSYQ
jgi:hypothetical protein